MLHHLLGLYVAPVRTPRTTHPESPEPIGCLAENGKIPKKVLQSTDECVCYCPGTCIFLAVSIGLCAFTQQQFLADASGRSLAIDRAT
jgi:hypothetical protein